MWKLEVCTASMAYDLENEISKNMPSVSVAWYGILECVVAIKDAYWLVG